jgi:hypothetical protein
MTRCKVSKIQLKKNNTFKPNTKQKKIITYLRDFKNEFLNQKQKCEGHLFVEEKEAATLRTITLDLAPPKLLPRPRPPHDAHPRKLAKHQQC